MGRRTPDNYLGNIFAFVLVLKARNWGKEKIQDGGPPGCVLPSPIDAIFLSLSSPFVYFDP